MRGLMAGYWFARRPCFWGAVIALLAVWATDRFSIPASAWAGVALAGCLTLPTRLRVMGAVLAVAALFGSLCGTVRQPPGSPALRDYAPITLRGEVVALLPGAGERRRIIVRARERRTRDGWVADRSRYGVTLAEPAVTGELAELSGRVEVPLPPTDPGGYDARHAWLQHGVLYVVRLRPSGYRVIGKVPPSPWRHWASAARDRVWQANRRTLSPEAAHIANSFLLGDGETPDPDLAGEVEESFRGSGTLHLLVVSGTQVGLVLWAFLWLAGRCWPGRYLFWLLGLGALAFFHAATSGDPSISRAAIVGCLVVGALACGRRVDGENCLGAAALILLLLNPFTLWNVGAQLSFAAVWSLIRVAPALESALLPAELEPAATVVRRLRISATRLLAGCVAAHLATAPLLAYHFHTASWSAVPANLCVALLASSFMFVALAHALLAQFGLLLLAPLAEGNARALHGWAGFFATPPLGMGSIYPPPGWLLPIYVVLLLLVSGGRKHREVVAGAACLLLATLFLSERLPAAAPAAPTVCALDIGQGDAVLLQGADGSNVLVDTGPPASGKTLVRALRALRLPALDALLISHAHLDHVGGFPELAEAFPPAQVLYDAGIAGAEEWRTVRATAEHLGIRLVPAAAGDRFHLRQSLLTILGPAPDDPRSSANEESLVARWDSGGARVLLTGDIGIGSEQRLLRWGPELRAELLKVGHHGSNGSTSPELLQAVQPRLAVLSCGRHNRFGHPGAAALARLREAGVPLLRTDEAGMVTIRLPARGPEVTTFLNPGPGQPWSISE